MIEEVILNRGVQRLERTLKNPIESKKLIDGGQPKDSVLDFIATLLKEDTPGQVGFLNSLFETIAKEGGSEPETTDRRDTATAILIDSTEQGVRVTEPIAPLIEAHSGVVGDAYIQALSQQTRDNDPGIGSIAALLDVGEAIAPYLRQDNTRMLEISRQWKRIKEQFPAQDEQNFINSRANEIRRTMFLIPKADLDTQVAALRKQGLLYHQIAELLDQERSTINSSVRRLLKAGAIEKSRRSGDQMVIFRANIVQLREDGRSIPQISEQTGQTKKYIHKIIGGLLDKGAIERAIPTPEYMANLAARMEPLQEEGHTNREISEKLNESYHRIRKLADRKKKEELKKQQGST